MSSRRPNRPKTQRGKRALKAREAKIVEDSKKALLLKGPKCSAGVTQLLRELHAMRRPLSVLFNRNNSVRPFEDEESITYLTGKNEAALFALGTSTKHKKNRLIMGRTFENQVLDMIEFEVVNFTSMSEFKGKAKSSVGSKPLVLFQGERFETDDVFVATKSLLMEFFLGNTELTELDLAGVEHVVIVSAMPGDFIHIGHYAIELKKSGSRLPRVELVEIGPEFDLVMHRTHFADAALMKDAMFVPKDLRPKKVKNVSRDAFGSVVGNIHMSRQDLTEVNTRKVKGLRRSRDKALAAQAIAEAAAEVELEDGGDAGPARKRSRRS
ncbi:brix domain-containing protein 1 [Thecamonas trahens ATCC 50062]|uniref:Ribosome production factor 2 homolog n=1 Tax=Thecamonas trahens ATCC 50062 TaxID=461836 RepID=A0A0L0DI21_THETB|nr:brix domain-containing protein 1 [Thecamonas trahens ATCC 50062]KNC51751.1 brix domain-containing protein 1 [Thecamonas trahens ATCC 50062]|eukprot:XP_013755879.1 brix domain-containing protein 1 [Thecamonas trahens ATCC 50062]